MKRITLSDYISALIHTGDQFDRDGFHRTASVVDDVLKRTYKHPLFDRPDQSMPIPVEPEISHIIRKPSNRRNWDSGRVEGEYSPSQHAVFLNEHGYNLVGGGDGSSGMSADYLHKNRFNLNNPDKYSNPWEDNALVSGQYTPEDFKRMREILHYHKQDDPRGFNFVRVMPHQHYEDIMQTLSHEQMHGNQRALSKGLGNKGQNVMNLHLADPLRQDMQRELPLIGKMNDSLEPFYEFENAYGPNGRFKDDPQQLNRSRFIEQMPHALDGGADHHFQTQESMTPFLYGVAYLHSIADQYGIDAAIQMGKNLGAAGRLALEQVLKDYKKEAPEDFAAPSKFFGGQLPEISGGKTFTPFSQKVSLTPEEEKAAMLFASDGEYQTTKGLQESITPNVVRALYLKGRGLNRMIQTMNSSHQYNPEILNLLSQAVSNGKTTNKAACEFFTKYKNKVSEKRLEQMRQYFSDKFGQQLLNGETEPPPYKSNKPEDQDYILHWMGTDMLTDDMAHQVFSKNFESMSSYQIASTLRKDPRLQTIPGINEAITRKFMEAITQAQNDPDELTNIADSLKKLPIKGLNQIILKEASKILSPEAIQSLKTTYNMQRKTNSISELESLLSQLPPEEAQMLRAKYPLNQEKSRRLLREELMKRRPNRFWQEEDE